MKRGLVFALIGVFVLAVAVVIIVALGGSKKTTITDNTLTIWSPFDEADAYKQISQQFLQDNPSIKLSFRKVDSTDAKDYEAKVVDAIASGAGPDIWLVRTDWLAKHQAKLTPSAGYVSWSKDKKTDQEAAQQYFGTAIADQNSRDGKLYGFPLSVDSLALYINTKVVSDASNALAATNQAEADKLGNAPTTWSDLTTWSRLLTKKDAKGSVTVGGLALGTTGNTYAPVDVFIGILSQLGGSLFTSDEKGVALHLVKVVNNQNQTPGLRALTLFSSFARPSDPNYSWSATMGDPVTAFVNNKLAMMIGYSTLSKDIQRADKNFDTVKIIPLPQIDDPAVTGKRVDVANYWINAVSKFSTKPQIAWAYLQALGSTGSQKYSQLTGKPAFTQSQDASIKLAAGDLGETALFAEQAFFAPAVYKPDWQTTDEIVQDMINQSLIANQSLQDAIDSAAERLKGLLK